MFSFFFITNFGKWEYFQFNFVCENNWKKVFFVIVGYDFGCSSYFWSAWHKCTIPYFYNSCRTVGRLLILNFTIKIIYFYFYYRLRNKEIKDFLCLLFYIFLLGSFATLMVIFVTDYKVSLIDTSLLFLRYPERNILDSNGLKSKILRVTPRGLPIKTKFLLL